MSGGGGGSGNSSGGNDMQVSGAEAAYSNEKGISTHADTRTSTTSYSGGGGEGNNTRPNPHTDSGTSKTSRSLGPDRSTVGIAKEEYSPQEIEKGYTDEGVQLSNVNGTYMTKAEMYSTGMIEKDPTTGKDVQGRYTVNPNTGEYERTDMSFAEHWQNAPEALKFSPTLRFLYASGKNVGEWANKKGFEGYNEAGKRPNDFFGNLSDGSSSNTTSPFNTGGSERDMMNALAPEAPYIVSGITPPTSSPASNWYANLGTTNTNQHSTDIATQYAAAKTAVSKTLQNKGPIGMLAVNQSPFYDWLKTNKLDRGIL
jgi:hypothetical protein